MALADYADTNYYEPTDGPVAVATQTKDKDGNDKTIYVDAQTGQVVNNLQGYTVKDGDIYWHPDQNTDANDDGKIDPSEARQGSQQARNEVGSGKSVAAGGGPKGTASNNFGYHSKPTGALKAAGVVGSLVNPGIGAAVGVLGKAYNVANMDAANQARIGLGLPGLTGRQRVSQSMKDNKGQIANVNIGDNKYSVGFEALSPDNKTNLTYNEAKTRAAILGKKITETPKDQVTPAPETAKKQSVIGKALDHLFGTADPSLPDQAPTPTERPGQVPEAVATEVTKAAAPAPSVAPAEPSFAQTPETMTAPEARPSVPTALASPAPSQEASIGLPDKDQGLTGPVGVSDATDSSARSVTPGAGLANLAGAAGKAAAEASGVGPNNSSYSHPERGAWNAGMDADTAETAARLAGTTPGMKLSSTVRSPAINAAIGGAKKSAHMVGKAFDVDTSGMTDAQKQKTVEMGRLAGATRIGTYADQSLHFDTLPGFAPNPDPKFGMIQSPDNTYGMFNRTAYDAAKKAPGWFTAGMTEDKFAPTPTPRPDPTVTDATSTIAQDKTFDSQVGLNALDRTDQDQNAFGKMVSSMSGLATSENNNTKQPDTPAGLAAMGFTNRSPEEKATIARTVAGELGQKSLRALAGTDPDARANALAEVGSMVATMENRAATTKYAGIAATLAPSQYNANMATNAAVTNQNYASNPAVSQAVGQFYSGGLPGTQYGATNYHATNMANPPSWSGQMTGTAELGQHTFGTLKGYSPSPSEQSRVNAFGTMAGTNFSPGKAKDDASLGVYGGTPSANTNSVGTTPGSNSSTGASKSDSSSSSSSSSGSGSSGAGGLGTSKSGDKSPAGGYASSASKGSTGGL